MRSVLRARDRARGSTVIEFALVALFFLSLIFASFNFFFWTFAKAALHSAVREGTRYAITGKTVSQMGQDDSIRKVVKDNAFGLLNSASAAATIRVDYYAVDGSGVTPSNQAGNFVVVSVVNYEPVAIAPVLGFQYPIRLSVRAVDKLEPFPGLPPPRTLPPP
jgi:Flp pilus assembly protein TadG